MLNVKTNIRLEIKRLGLFLLFAITQHNSQQLVWLFIYEQKRHSVCMMRVDPTFGVDASIFIIFTHFISCVQNVVCTAQTRIEIVYYEFAIKHRLIYIDFFSLSLVPIHKNVPYTHSEFEQLCSFI